MLVPLDLSDIPYEGTLSLMRNEAHTARRNRGKWKGNAPKPRSRTLAGLVRDEAGNVLNIARKRSTAPRRVATAPQNGMTYAERVAKLGAVGGQYD